MNTCIVLKTGESFWLYWRNAIKYLDNENLRGSLSSLSFEKGKNFVDKVFEAESMTWN